MAYTITKTDGTQLVAVADGTIDNTTSLTLIGQNYSNYGEIINESLIHLLENFADRVQPGKPIVGQLWYDTQTNRLRVYNGYEFIDVAADAVAAGYQVPVSGEIPVAPELGNLWYNANTGDLMIYNGSEFVPSSLTITVALAPNPNSTIGDLWFNTDNHVMQIFNGVEYVDIVPSSALTVDWTVITNKPAVYPAEETSVWDILDRTILNAGEY